MKIKDLFIANIFLSIILVPNLLFAQKLKPSDGIEVTYSTTKESVKSNFYIQNDYQIHIPYLGKINTVNKDFSEIKSEIIAGYTDLYRNPEIHVQPLLRIKYIG